MIRPRMGEYPPSSPLSSPDSICYPKVSDTKYPYTPDGFGVGLSPWPEDFLVTGTDWVPRVEICPVPSAPVPVLIGGRLAEFRRAYGREREPFATHAISMHAYTADGVRMLEDLGVTDVIVGLRDPHHMPDRSLPEKFDYARRYADDVIEATR